MEARMKLRRCVFLLTTRCVFYIVCSAFVVGQVLGCANRHGKGSKQSISQYRAEKRAAQRQNVDEPGDPALVPKARTPVRVLESLAKSVGASHIRIQNTCVEGSARSCYRQALDRTFLQLDSLSERPERNVRILQLGDSHIAGDYITGTARQRLQERFGNAGRGFVHVEQKAPYGGRRLKRSGPWRRTRIVDQGQAGNDFGFSGMSYESVGNNASIEYKLDGEARIYVHYLANPKGSVLKLSINGKNIGTLDTYSETTKTKSRGFTVPKQSSSSSTDKRVLKIRSEGPGSRIFGISYERKDKGLFYDSIGPVGADAKVYLSLGRRSFVEQLQELKPDLVIIMLGGNDAMRVRKKTATIQKIGEEHKKLIEVVQYALPNSDCMLWSPMDAGKMKEGQIVSKTFIREIRYIQQKVAVEKGCAFWDMYQAMGEEGSVARWSKRRIMNKDLIHPRRKAGELLGYLFAESFLRAYDQTE